MIEFKQGQRLVIPVEVVHEPGEDPGTNATVGVMSTLGRGYLGRFSPACFQLPGTVSEQDGIALAAARAEIRILRQQMRELVGVANAQAFQLFELQALEEARSACG